MIEAPSFLLAGPDGVVVGEGLHTAYPDVAAARAALAGGTTPIIVGALPFDVTQPAALMRPASAHRTATLPSWPRQDLPRVHVEGLAPPPDEHRARIATALEALRDPATGLRKVVLARALRLRADAPIDVPSVIARLADDRSATTYFADLTPAGGSYAGAALVGASPELLVARDGATVTCRPFAGSAPRDPDAAVDRANGAALAASAKNRHEHQLVVDAMRATLEPLCSDLHIAEVPELSSTATVWHLSTPITGTLRESSFTALDLALALHPTPAVGGVPRDAATDRIRTIEGDRGFYAYFEDSEGNRVGLTTPA